MYTPREFTVLPTIPGRLQPLRKLAMNLWWTWNAEAQELFRRLDPKLWDQIEHNPVKLLNTIDQARLQRAAGDSAYLAHLDRVLKGFEAEMSEPGWFERTYPDLAGKTIAYFSAEFGLHESLPQYAGGLGVLAGDHLKAASDLGVPVVGVSLMYQFGYFHQHLLHDGRQVEEYPRIDLANTPITLATGSDGKPLKVAVEMRDHLTWVQIWKAQAGRVPLLLLDTHVPENSAEDQQITSQLYGGDEHMRIRQEMILGFGGCRTLQAMGIEPYAFHMNEGHSAFLAIERVRHLVQSVGLSFSEAKQAVAACTTFTTHTPVPAGIDTFPPDLVASYLRPVTEKLGVGMDEVLALGRQDRNNHNERFSMAILALRLASAANGVSRLHGYVSRKMWRNLWPELPIDEVPLTSVTNGVHIRTWQSLEMGRLFDRYLGPDWSRDPNETPVWERVDEIPDAELWRAHERQRDALVAATRTYYKRQLERRGASPVEIDEADQLLNPEVLTIGFARRFAPYKRATLLLREPQRLEALLADEDRPIQIIFAGKAHPRDELGKELIMKIVQFARQPRVRKRIVFLEDYTMGIARFLVQGVDVWLNNPIRLLEASGTSGMKVAPNGGINFSILDGWWAEAYDGTNGWAIGDTRVYDNQEYQNSIEAQSLYDTLTQQVIPLFYDRGRDGLPKRWIAMMKASMRSCSARFSANRMVREYTDRMYVPAVRRSVELAAAHFAGVRSMTEWMQRIRHQWDQVHVRDVSAPDTVVRSVGDAIQVTSRVFLGEIKPEDVTVEVYYGPMNGTGQINDGQLVVMKPERRDGDGAYLYQGSVPCAHPGRFGFAVRVVPNHPALPNRHTLGLIRWG